MSRCVRCKAELPRAEVDRCPACGAAIRPAPTVAIRGVSLGGAPPPPPESRPTVQTRGIVLGQPPPAASPVSSPEPKPTVQTRGIVLGQPPPAASPVSSPEPKPTVQTRGIVLGQQHAPQPEPKPTVLQRAIAPGVPAASATPRAPAATVVGVRGISLGASQPASAPTPSPAGRPTGPVANPPPSARGVGWEAWLNAGAMPSRVRVAGETWDLVDSIDVRDPGSEELHGFEVLEATRLLREQGTFRYPSGGPVEDRGYRHFEGYVRFVVRNLTPYAPLAIVRRVLATGEEHLSVRVAGVHAADVHETDCDARAPWRNRALQLALNRIVAPEVRVELADEGSPDGVTWFAVWCYQPVPEG